MSFVSLGDKQIHAGCLFTEFYKNRETVELVRNVMSTMDVMVYGNLIRRCGSVPHSIKVRKPLAKCASKSTAAEDYRDFTEEHLAKEDKSWHCSESLINDTGKGGKRAAGFSVTMVHYTKLIPSESNNYSMDSIKELAQMIVLSGKVEQNLLARKKTPDEYELIAGHRRRQAVKYLVEECGREEYAMLPVHVEQDGDTMSEIKLILTNSSARTRSDWERMMEVTRLTDLLKAMQTGSQEERDRFREWIGMDPGISGGSSEEWLRSSWECRKRRWRSSTTLTTAWQLKMKDKFKSGEIGVSVANEAAGLPPEKQQELCGERRGKTRRCESRVESTQKKRARKLCQNLTRRFRGSRNRGRIIPGTVPAIANGQRLDPELRKNLSEFLARKLIENNKAWCKQDFQNRVLNVVESEKQFKQKFRGVFGHIISRPGEWENCLGGYAGCLHSDLERRREVSGKSRMVLSVRSHTEYVECHGNGGSAAECRTPDAANEQQDGAKHAAEKQQEQATPDKPVVNRKQPLMMRSLRRFRRNR